MPLNLGTTIIEDVKLGNTQVLQVALGSTPVWVATVEATLSNDTQVNVQNLFSSADWTSPKTKRVIIPSGVTIGSSAVATPAMRTGTGWGGELIIENSGSMQGAGGVAGAPTGGVGGDAFQADAYGVQLINFNQIFAGGGGGGRGGTGGGGSYQSPYNYREPSSGWYFSYPATCWITNGSAFTRVFWSSSQIFQISGTTATSRSAGGWTYLRGAYQGGADGDAWYQVARQQTRYNTINTNGGAGGNGGRGQGYGQSRASGSGGASGGTNAGTGGTGGLGGLFGANGATGNTGANGNRTNGLAGVAGGLAGFALRNAANIILTNSGDIRGRT